MNTAGGEGETDDEPSRINEDPSSSKSVDNPLTTIQTIEGSSTSQQALNSAELTTNSTAPCSVERTTSPKYSTVPEMKRSAVKELIERYFYQLQRGCGNRACTNVHCASSGQVPSMTPNEIAARAIQLFSQDAQLCVSESQPPKVPRTKGDSPSTSHSESLVTAPSNPESDNSSSDSNSGNSTMTTGSRSSTSSNSSSSYSVLAFISSSEGDDVFNATANTATTTSAASNVAPIHSSSATACSSTSKEFQRSLIDLNATTAPLFEPRTPSPPPPPLIDFLDEKIIDMLFEECRLLNSYQHLIEAIDSVFSSTTKLSKSFKRNPEVKQISTGMSTAKLHELLGKSPNKFKKEDLRSLEGDADKDEDSSMSVQCGEPMDETMAEAEAEASSGAAAAAGASGGGDQPRSLGETLVDLESLRRTRKKLFSVEDPSVGDAITNAVLRLADGIKYRLALDWEKVIHCFVICFDMAASSFYSMAEQDYLECALPKLCHAARVLPASMQARLASIWATHSRDQLISMVRSCHQLITMQVILDEDSVQENVDVIAVTRVLRIAFYANILAGQWEKPKEYTNSAVYSFIDDDDVFSYTHTPKPQYPNFAEDRLEAELGVSFMDCRIPLYPFEEFYNEPLSDAIQMDRDYLAYKSLSLDPQAEDTHFSFMLYSFILTPATKVIALYYDSRIRMYSERNSSLFSLLNYFGDNQDAGSRPDLKLKVRRDNIIGDALIALEMIAMGNPKDLKKQLVVEFIGEEGIDEGGVSKEFFQLIVEEIFNPDFGMFTYQEETNTVWFNPSPFENGAQFTLIGIILGLAIYNNIILAVHFPMVVYRKLMDSLGTFYDLADWNPTLYRSLKALLDYEEPDIEDVFMQTFKITYNNMFGEIVEHELKPGGGDICVGHQNKREFVDLYSDFLLNKSIDKQFRAFKKGFEMVTDESPLRLLFRPEEIELLVCGSPKFDFVELETSTEYEGGYTKDTAIIKDFWNVVHSMPEESKRKLLEFTTGSDRVPVGGLSRLKLLITRHGPDSDRLPTSHTCFNVLLLPEYNNKEKLEERLLKAINYSKGFGML